MQKKLNQYLGLIAFSHTVFAMPFAFVGFFIGARRVLYTSESATDELPLQTILTPTMGKQFLLVLGCMVFARSAAPIVRQRSVRAPHSCATSGGLHSTPCVALSMTR